MKRVLFICAVCECEHDDEFRAEDCCPKIIERRAWECQDCRHDFDNQHDADECCANDNLDSYNHGKEKL